MCLALTLILGIKGKQDFRAQGCFMRQQATHHQRYRGRVYASQIFFAKDRYSLYVLRYFFNGPSLCSGNRSNAARMFTARQAATKICAANCANGSFAQFAAKESSQKSKKPAISSKMVKFSRSQQTRAKARDYELGNMFRHTRSRGL